MSIENIINKAWENKEQVGPNSDQNLKDAINQIIEDLDCGKSRVAEKIDGKWMINNRTNYYHKPVYNLNHLWKISDQMSLSSVLYGSNGRGGGTGPLNSRGNFMGDGNYGTAGEVSYFKYINPPKDEHGRYEWGKLINWNASNWDADNVGDPDYIATEHRSKAIIRASVNHHDWYGLMSSFKFKDVVPDVTVTTGVDLRSYQGIHYREVVNLLGGDYYVDTYNYGRPYSDVNDDATTAIKRVGDKIAYHNIGYNSWAGGFLQAEYSNDDLSAFFSAAGWEITADMLTLGQIFGLTLLIIGIWAWRIPDALGESVKSMGMLYSLGGALWTLMIIYHVATGAAGGPTAYVNLVITAVFAVLFYMYSKD